MTWKPSKFHLDQAIAVVDMICMDAKEASDQISRATCWRMTLAIADALSKSEDMGRLAFELEMDKYQDKNLDGVPKVTMTNGGATVTYPSVDPVTARHVEAAETTSSWADLHARSMRVGSDVASEATSFVMPLPYKDESGAVVQPDPAEMAQQMLSTSDPATVKFLSETAHQLVKDQQATKRGRGRPKGAKGKKKKAKVKMVMAPSPDLDPLHPDDE